MPRRKPSSNQHRYGRTFKEPEKSENKIENRTNCGHAAAIQVGIDSNVGCARWLDRCRDRYRHWRIFQSASHGESTCDQSRQETNKPKVVDPKTLAALELSPVTAGSTDIESGNVARFQMRVANHAESASKDPRRLNSKARVAAQIAVYITPEGGVKRKAPVFPKKFSPTQLPTPGETSQVEIIFVTSGLLAGDYKVTFELQSPSGWTINSHETDLTISENLGEIELLGFQELRTHAGGADAYISSSQPEKLLGSEKVLRLHHKGNGNQTAREHVYLTFDLSKGRVANESVDRAVLLLTLGAGSWKGKSTVYLYGTSMDWSEAGEDGLKWNGAPSETGVQSLQYLADITVDNSGDALKGKVDAIRLYGANLDDYIRTSESSTITLVLVRENKATEPTVFTSKEGQPQHAPALALRPKT